MMAAASCHTPDDVARAGVLDLDFAVSGDRWPDTHASASYAARLGWLLCRRGGHARAGLRAGRARTAMTFQRPSRLARKA